MLSNNQLRENNRKLREENELLRTALRIVLGDADHGQNQTWEERCRIGRAALEK